MDQGIHFGQWDNERQNFEFTDPQTNARCSIPYDVEVLKVQLSQPGRSFNLRNTQSGNTLLHIAVLYEKNDIFDFLMTVVKDINLNAKNKKEETPLIISTRSNREGYVKKLLELGADPNMCNCYGLGPLHCVTSTEMAKLLIKHGANVDQQTVYGATPIMKACLEHRNEIFHLLFYFGADITIPDNSGWTIFVHALLRRNTELEEVLLPFFIDGQNMELSCIYFASAMIRSSATFQKLCEVCEHITYDEKEDLYYFFEYLLDFSPDLFNVFVVKFKQFLIDGFEHLRATNKHINVMSEKGMKHEIAIINILDEHDLLTEAIDTILIRDKEYAKFYYLLEGVSDATVEENKQLPYTLVTRGMPLKFFGLDAIYQSFGDCELFRFLLHCDLTDSYIPGKYSLMVAIFSNVNLNIEWILKNLDIYVVRESDVVDLLEQFASRDLQQFAIRKFPDVEEIQTKVKKLPSVPTLLELSRNKARRHIVNTFQFTCSRHFYTCIHWLDISQVYKDILTFKTKLYL